MTDNQIENIKNMIKNKVLIVGKIEMIDGFVNFNRLKNITLEDIDSIRGDNIRDYAFASNSMGRAIFSFDEDEKIHNYKGVDSQLTKKENKMINNVGAETVDIEINKKNQFQVNFIIYPGGRPEIRFRGSSPLEDLEEEAEINSIMANLTDSKGQRVKLPQIISVREFSESYRNYMGLPEFVEGSMDAFQGSTYDDRERKKYLSNLNSIEYQQENTEDGYRPSTLKEYFEKNKLFDNDKIKDYIRDRYKKDSNFRGMVKEKLKNKKITIGEVIDLCIEAVDTYYERGQRFGQTERIIENPFRISDLENILNNPELTEEKKKNMLESIASFTEEQLSLNSDFENKSFEVYYAQKMGQNIATMLNCGWCMKGFKHRQDFSLAAEMCDDTYNDREAELELINEQIDKSNDGKKNTLYWRKYELEKQPICAILMLASTIKILQNEMQCRGKSKKEIDSILTEFSKSFAISIDKEKGQAIKNKIQDIENNFQDENSVMQNWSDYFSSEQAEKIKINPETKHFHENFSEFYSQFVNELKEDLDKKMENNQQISSKNIRENQTQKQDGLTLQQVGKATTYSFSKNEQSAKKTIEAFENGVELQESEKRKMKNEDYGDI